MTTCLPCTVKGSPGRRRHHADCRAVRQSLIEISLIVCPLFEVAKSERLGEAAAINRQQRRSYDHEGKRLAAL